ncbi:hypothetical protein [Flavisolibacter ginsenosidimutans]|uniref:Uncharacterized protein n=1 Tax=Flavisolibacter ginsenosidimutans TaxID=661481 RepID=A0A5B8UP19_9BACT|nr:hypothetical protein [Flavisolibacter ginsenosidimutans]QEC57705.1 hypothetical protein FSB75_17940 [Flavisolibacter ginsenosidimutans]
MKVIWFKKWGWTYLPVHPIGIVITLLAMLFLVPIYAAIVRNGHSVSDDLYKMFVYTTCTAFWWKWIADKTSSNAE